MRPIVFDFDGVLVDTERVWEAVRRDVALEHGGRWDDGASSRMQGLSTPEWSALMIDELGTQLGRDEVADVVIEALEARIAAAPPWLPGAPETIRRLAAAGHPLAVASSSPRRLLYAILADLPLAVIVSSEEVPRGKPSPDVYLEAARRLGTDPRTCIAVEDSSNGLRAAAAAGMTVYAVPNEHDPPAADALSLAARCAPTVAELF